MITSIKLFKESLRNSIIEHLTNAAIGTIVDESDVYQYVEQLHYKDDPYSDMENDGNLAQRIEVYKQFKLMEIDIDQIQFHQFLTDLDTVKSYSNKFNETQKYPPIVLGHQFLTNDEDFSIEKDPEGNPIIIGEDYEVIDGAHRINALLQNNITKVKAWVGIL